MFILVCECDVGVSGWLGGCVLFLKQDVHEAHSYLYIHVIISMHLMTVSTSSYRRWVRQLRCFRTWSICPNDDTEADNPQEGVRRIKRCLKNKRFGMNGLPYEGSKKNQATEAWEHAPRQQRSMTPRAGLCGKRYTLSLVLHVYYVQHALTVYILNCRSQQLFKNNCHICISLKIRSCLFKPTSSKLIVMDNNVYYYELTSIFSFFSRT